MKSIIAGGIIIVSISVHIWQAIKNRSLRKQIEKLVAIIDNLQNDIDELKKEVSALKFWAFREKYKLKKEIRIHNTKIEKLSKEITGMTDKFAA